MEIFILEININRIAGKAAILEFLKANIHIVSTIFLIKSDCRTNLVFDFFFYLLNHSQFVLTAYSIIVESELL